MVIFGKRQQYSEVGPKKPPAPAPKQKLFGEKGYSTFDRQRKFARTAPDSHLPGTSRKLYKRDREVLITELQKRAQKIGKSHGLSESTYKSRIAPNVKREINELRRANKHKESNELRRKAKMWEEWITKGI